MHSGQRSTEIADQPSRCTGNYRRRHTIEGLGRRVPLVGREDGNADTDHPWKHRGMQSARPAESGGILPASSPQLPSFLARTYLLRGQTVDMVLSSFFWLLPQAPA